MACKPRDAEKAAGHGSLLSHSQQLEHTGACSRHRCKALWPNRAEGALELLSRRLCPSPSSLHRLWWLAWRDLSANKCLGWNHLPLSASRGPESPSFSSCVSKCNCIQENPSRGLFGFTDCLMGLSFLSFRSLYKHTTYITQAKSHSRHFVCLNCFEDQDIYLRTMLFS